MTLIDLNYVQEAFHFSGLGKGEGSLSTGTTKMDWSITTDNQSQN